VCICFGRAAVVKYVLAGKLFDAVNDLSTGVSIGGAQIISTLQQKKYAVIRTILKKRKNK
jgi:hypothetical protein